jgi:anthranilate phosphoribosyltransferase
MGFLEPSSDPFLNLIKKIISKKELSEEECLQGMDFLFNPGTPEYLKGPFLEGERLKRESYIENKVFFNYLYNKIPHLEIDIPILIDICDSYDGSNRSKNFSLFTAALLASAGFPALVHGVKETAPKFGHTSHQILLMAKKNPFTIPEIAIANLKNPEIRWAYIDQEIYFKSLYQLQKVRKEMVKRPFLATFEKLLQPIKIRSGNYIVTGFTHPHYKEELVKQLKDQGKCQQALILKGVEGSTHLSLSKTTSSVHFNGKDIKDSMESPESFGIPILESKQDRSITAKDSLEEGLAALKGERNYARENILYLACLIISKFSLMDASKAHSLLSKNIDTGKALKHWQNVN